MIVTEEEAKTKRCQESYPAASGLAPDGAVTFTSWSYPPPPGLQAGAAGGGAVINAPSYCIGSRCMAWWFVAAKTERVETDLGQHPKGEGWYQVDRGDSFGLVWERKLAPAGGYCGKAGKP